MEIATHIRVMNDGTKNPGMLAREHAPGGEFIGPGERARLGESVRLDGEHVRLEPLSLEHLDGLCAVGLDPDLWQWTAGRVDTRDEMRRYVENALERAAEGTAIPFATIERREGRVIGSTRFGSIAWEHRRVEIGWTWIARAWQRTAINTEAKYLMLRHAFETMGCVRVELKTDALNARSRAAILRIGATEEGVLRQHMITTGDRLRDTVYFSIIDGEWPRVRAHLESLLRTPSTPPVLIRAPIR
jgi:RimJ/RimL family protein N-acetyltransferase